MNLRRIKNFDTIFQEELNKEETMNKNYYLRFWGEIELMHYIIYNK